MIDKLRKKIFWIIQISLTIIVLGIIIIFTSFSYRNTITFPTMFMDRINVGEDFRNDPPKDKIESKNENMPFSNEGAPLSIDVEGVYRFEIKDNNITRESNDADDTIRKYAIQAVSKNREEGYVGNYIYKIRKFNNNEVEVTLMENANTIKRLKLIIALSFIIGIAGIIIIYIIAKKLSSTIIKPVEKSFERQKQFVSDASHELKTPLAVIEANADVLHDKVGENKWITYIQNEIQSMNKLVNDLLVLAKMENTNNISFQKFNLSKEVELSVAVFESMIYEKEIKLETSINEDIYFNGDKEDIKHIVSIILDNAIKHTDKNNKIIVDVEKEKNDIKIEIKNQGAPIPDEEQEKIFERFYRIDKSRNRNEKRYGLGLSIAKEIVNKYNGTIKASSSDGFTSFLVRLNCR